MTLSTNKCTIGPMVKDPKVRDSIDFHVKWSSLWAHLGSLVMFAHTVNLYNNGGVLEQLKTGTHATNFVIDAFSHHKSINARSRSISLNVLNLFSYDLNWMDPASWSPELRSSVSQIPGCTVFIKGIADTYASSMEAHVTNNTETFIRNTIETFMLLQGMDYTKTHPYAIDLLQKIINGDNHQYSYNSPAINIQARNDFIKYHRDYLDSKNIDLSDVGIKDTEKKILYFCHLLSYQDDNSKQMMQDLNREPKRFFSVPIHRIGLLSTLIGGKSFYYILKKAGITLPVGNVAAFTAEKHHQRLFPQHFNLSRFESVSGRRSFQHGDRIKTNGVKFSVTNEIDDNAPRGTAQRRPRNINSSSECAFCFDHCINRCLIPILCHLLLLRRSRK